MKQIQAKNQSEWIRINIDEPSRHNIDRIHKVTQELLNVRMSDSVLARRALMLYRLHILEGMAKAYESSDDPEKRMEAVTRFCELERACIHKAAESEGTK